MFVSIVGSAQQADTLQSKRYAAYIEMPRAYVSGVCILLQEGSETHGSLFNEFGITALDFTYYSDRRRVKLHSVMKVMDKWYIRRILRRDLRNVIERIDLADQDGCDSVVYVNKRQQITYKLKKL